MTDWHWVIGPESAGTRLDKFLAAAGRIGSHGRAARALERGKVFLNGREAQTVDAATRLATGDAVRVWMDRPGSARGPRRPAAPGKLDVVFEDQALLVVNKPAGLLAMPLERSQAPSAYDRVRDHLQSRGKRRPLPVHRIDRDTSGLVMFARTAQAQRSLKEQFLQREPERIYLAVVHGRPRPAEGTWRDLLSWHPTKLVQRKAHPDDRRAKEAISDYRVIEHFAAASLLEVRLQTGKRNQIRIQAQLRGHPLVGERLYVSATEPQRPIPFGRQALHAHRLSFRHPTNGRLLTFEAPLPEDMVNLIARLRRS
jgi:23S rRNA pseudouridine1911/1915/1917 synthase